MCLNESHLIFVEGALQLLGKQFRESNHSVEGRSELMAHVAEEVGLQAIGPFDFLPIAVGW